MAAAKQQQQTLSDVPLLRPTELAQAVETLTIAQRPAIITGPPGVGKSRIMFQVAEKLGMQVVDMRLSIRDAVDLRGIPKATEDNLTMWCPPAELPREGKGILFLDEITSAPPPVQVAAYQLILDRGIGEYRLPDGWTVMAAGNREEDGAVVYKMSSALNSRLVHLGMDISAGVFQPDWHNWALVSRVHPHVIAFCKQFPNELNQFDKTKKAYPCARTWEFVSDILKQDCASPAVEFALISGTIGPEMAVKFQGYLKLCRELPQLDDIIKRPAKAIVPTDVSALFAVSAALATQATVKNWAAILTYAKRLPSEYTVMTVQDCLRATKQALADTPEFLAWALENTKLMGAMV